MGGGGVSRRIQKYRLMPGTPIPLDLPRDAIFRAVGSQDDGPVLWFEVETTATLERREFFVYGTGHAIIEDGLSYLGTTQTDEGLVWHVYERPPRRAA